MMQSTHKWKRGTEDSVHNFTFGLLSLYDPYIKGYSFLYPAFYTVKRQERLSHKCKCYERNKTSILTPFNFKNYRFKISHNKHLLTINTWIAPK